MSTQFQFVSIWALYFDLLSTGGYWEDPGETWLTCTPESWRGHYLSMSDERVALPTGRLSHMAAPLCHMGRQVSISFLYIFFILRASSSLFFTLLYPNHRLATAPPPSPVVDVTSSCLHFHLAATTNTNQSCPCIPITTKWQKEATFHQSIGKAQRKNIKKTAAFQNPNTEIRKTRALSTPMPHLESTNRSIQWHTNCPLKNSVKTENSKREEEREKEMGGGITGMSKFLE